MVGKPGAQGARGAPGALASALCVFVGCSYLPARQEIERTRAALATVDSVAEVRVACGGRILASDSACADVVMKDGSRLRFDRVGFNSFGSRATSVVVSSAGALVPRVASCSGVGPPNFHRSTPLGRHFHPTLIDLKDAAFRYREVLEEIEFWPQCPQYFEVEDTRGLNLRYCARREPAGEEPPRPQRCP